VTNAGHGREPEPRMTPERHSGSATELHGLEMPDDGRRHLWLLEVTAPAVVLGSTQRDDVVDRDLASRRGVEVARRRSGGGAVWVAPGNPVWVDVLLPRSDPEWDDDVARSFVPVGRAWVEALATVGVDGATVHDGPMVRTDWSDAVCFAGVGPGEVLVDGAKVVGISQRRTRAGARFQCAVPRRWDPEPLTALLRPSPPLPALRRVALGVGDVDTARLVDAFLRALG
jgi:lipoate-protein ligase A